jgi:hydrogenase expression/formation protein HypE
LGWERIEPGDGIIVTGTIADHGIAILGAREGFDFGGQIASDTASLHRVVTKVLDAGIDVHFLRDPTRGGVSAVLHELAEQTGCSMLIEERRIPVAPEVRGACELLGLDPLYVANEGKMLLFVPAAQVESALELLGEEPLSRDATHIGEVSREKSGRVLIRGPLGRLRILDEPSGAPLPRIC